jgi:hypothetical protein
MTNSTYTKYWVVDVSNKMLTYNYIYNVQQSEKDIGHKNSSTFINQEKHILVKSDSFIDMNSCPITLGIKKPSENGPFKYDSLLRDQFNKIVKIDLISREVTKVRLVLEFSSSISINLGGYRNIYCPDV